MGWTKRQFIMQAFEEIGLSPYVFDLTPDQIDGALRRLDTMVAGWNAAGISIGFPLPSSPDNSDLDTQTNVPDSATEAICANLAIRIAPMFGKSVSSETLSVAATAYRNLERWSTALPPEIKLPGSMPIGQGAKRVCRPFIGQDSDASCEWVNSLIYK